MNKNAIQFFVIGLLYLSFFSCSIKKVIYQQPILWDRDTILERSNSFKYQDKFEISMDTISFIGDGIKISLRNIGAKTGLFSEELYLYDNGKSLEYIPIDLTYQLPIVMASIPVGTLKQIQYVETINRSQAKIVKLYWVTNRDVFIKALNGKFVVKANRYLIKPYDFNYNIDVVEIKIEYLKSNQFLIKIKGN